MFNDVKKLFPTLAHIAKRQALLYFRKKLTITSKSSTIFDPVTLADQNIEKALRRAILTKFPEHGIMGEEYAPLNEGSAYQWLIDPIDGTKSFITGLPLWGTLIAFSAQEKLIYGMMYQPFTGEIFFGDTKRATLAIQGKRPKPITVNAAATLAKAILYTTSPLLMNAGERAKFENVQEKVLLTRYGGDCYTYCMLAAGFVDLVIETNINSYDIAALIPIIKGAGGIITTWQGGNADHGGQIIASSSATLHAEAIKLLNA